MVPDRLTPILQKAIRDSGLSLNALAEQAEVDDGQLSRFMRDDRTLSLPVAAKVCAVLGLELKLRRRKGK
jgi:plasmid maintenance system antidote protein VapI